MELIVIINDDPDIFDVSSLVLKSKAYDIFEVNNEGYLKSKNIFFDNTV